MEESVWMEIDVISEKNEVSARLWLVNIAKKICKLFVGKWKKGGRLQGGCNLTTEAKCKVLRGRLKDLERGSWAKDIRWRQEERSKMFGARVAKTCVDVKSVEVNTSRLSHHSVIWLLSFSPMRLSHWSSLEVFSPSENELMLLKLSQNAQTNHDVLQECCALTCATFTYSCNTMEFG